MAGHDYVVVEGSEPFALLSKALADLALDPVAVDRTAARFQRDAETEMADVVLDAEHGALGKADNLALAKEAPILPRVVESERGRKS
jgi:hypothetical protein